MTRPKACPKPHASWKNNTATYRTMIPGIRGQHYRLTNEQWDALCKPLKIGAIPAYVLVDKDGTYARRDDLMDTRLLIKTLKDKLNNP